MSQSNNLIKIAKLIRKLQNKVNLKEMVIQLEKTGVQTPSFVLTIDKMGKVTFEGISNVEVKGIKTKEITEEQIQQILQKFSDVYFFSFRDNYISGRPDSFTKISIKADELIKEVAYNENSKVPKPLLSLEQGIKEIADVQEWIGK